MRDPHEHDIVRSERHIREGDEPEIEEHVKRISVVERPAYSYRAVEITWFVVAVLATLILIRFLLKLFGANPQADFVSLVYGVSEPLVFPFHGIFRTAAQGGYVLEPESVVALVVYLLIGWGIVTLIRIATEPRPPRVRSD